ncbi:MAG: hypothetical protein WA891_21430 [Acidobacteriaceae bacterium]
MSRLGDLRRVIHELHGAKATYIESVAVREMYKGRIVWDGVVEVFDLAGHPKTNRIYAWAHDTDDPKQPKRYVTVLHIPPVVSPQTAVQAVILQEYKARAQSN